MIYKTVSTAELEPGDIVAGHGTVASVTTIPPSGMPRGTRGLRRVEFTDAPPVEVAAQTRRWDLEQPPPTYCYPVRTVIRVDPADPAPGEPGQPTVFVISDGQHRGFAVENGDEQLDVVAVGEDGHGVELGRVPYLSFAAMRFGRLFGHRDPQISLPAPRPAPTT
jgi:hypothetical protein